MNRILFRIAIAVAALAVGQAALAASQTVTLPVKMTCPMSEPPVITLLLSRVAGVSEVEVSYDDQAATVVFDDAKTDADALKAVLAEFTGEQLGPGPAPDDLDDM